MIFRSEIKLNKSSVLISHDHKIYLTGSCFSENISEKFNINGFHTQYNSHGILYNPVSISKSIEDIANNKEYSIDDIVCYDEKYFSFNHHGSFSGFDKGSVIDKINLYLSIHKNAIKDSSHAFITLGTSWVYIWNETQKIVANCHKIPASNFRKKILGIEEIKEAIFNTIFAFKKINTNIHLVFTISPVKHLRDGVIENNHSKALLYVALQEVLKENKDVSYFPSYELVMDDLRDYRYWKEDFMHPNEIAINYVWEKLAEHYFSEETLQLSNQCNKLIQMKNHKIIEKNTEKILEYEKMKNEKILAFKEKFPFVNI